MMGMKEHYDMSENSKELGLYDGANKKTMISELPLTIMLSELSLYASRVSEHKQLA
jgi:hypothetical protein